MKKLIYIFATLILIFCISSCEQTKYAILYIVPADAEFAASFSPSQIASKAGIGIAKDNTLQFPQTFIENSDPSTLKYMETINTFLSGSGLNLDSLAVFFRSYQDEPVFVLKLKDKDKFVKKLTENGYEFIRGQLGVRIYFCKDSEQNLVVATRGDVAVITPLAYEDIDDIYGCFSKPSENSMSRYTQEKILVKGDPDSVANFPSYLKKAITTDKPECEDVLFFFNDVLPVRGTK